MAAADHIPSTDEILRAIGAGGSRRNSDAVSTIALFGAGLLVGAGLAVLFTPVSGGELREQLNEKTDDLRKMASDLGDSLRGEAEPGNGQG